MKEHVKGEPPELEPFVWSVNEDAIDGDRPRRIDFAFGGRVVRERAQLHQKKK